MASHDASASAIGYLYQTRWALVELVRSARERRTQELTIELFDDVAWGDEGKPVELLQLKHHGSVTAVGGLGDMSVDLWRTLKAWLDVPSAREADGPLLSLVTTATCSTGTAAWLLSANGTRDDNLALELLNRAAAESTSDSTLKMREAWLSTSISERASMVTRMRVFDAAAPIDTLDKELSSALGLIVPLHHEDAFIALVWRWWGAVSLDLLNKRRPGINGLDAYQELSHIRDGFTNTNLPTLVFEEDVEADHLLAVYSDKDFVHQLRWISVSTRNLNAAMLDYWMAIQHETEWVERDLVELAELQRFELKLVSEWERCYGDMLEDLEISGPPVTEEMKIQAGRELFRTLRDSALKIRSNYTEAFHARGKFHALADEHRIGWHPEFESRLRDLTLERKA